MMNAIQIQDAIRCGDREQVLFDLLTMVQVLSTAVLELNGEVKLRTGVEPLMLKSRVMLGDFIGLEDERR